MTLSPNLILFASPKLISTPKSHLMTKIWKYLDEIFSEKVTHLKNVGESLVNIKACSQQRKINVKYHHKCISFCEFSCLYRYPGQTQDKFKTFLKNCKLTLDKIHENNLLMAVVLGDFKVIFNLFSYGKKWPYFCMKILITLSHVAKDTSF